MMSTQHTSDASKAQHVEYLRQTIALARQSPPKPSNFRVGCVIVANSGPEPHVLSTGYTLELPGNTHAEQCALSKLVLIRSTTEEQLQSIFTPELNVTLYTSLEPCGKRLSGNLPCVQRIISTRTGNNDDGGIRKVVFGAKEPGTFVQDSQSCKLLTEAGIEWEYIPDLEEEILRVAMEGHVKHAENPAEQSKTGEGVDRTRKGGTNIDDISEEERKRQAALPRNPKKRMMEI